MLYRTHVMKRFHLATTVGLVLATSCAQAATTIDAGNHFAYGANLGWMDWRGDTANGAVIGEYVCSGYVYSANVGWISLGGGSPANGIQYQNNSGTDFGVNTDGLGNLRGYAYGANIGWINFENTGAPKVDIKTGLFSGYAYSANCGWISLSNAVALVQTDSIQQGVDSNHDGIPDAWELQNFGTISINVNADPDGDGMSNLQEYLAGTDPNNAASNLKITAQSFSAGGTFASLTWNSVLTRCYYVEKATTLGSANWTDSGLGQIASAGSATSTSLSDTNASARFYRIRAVRPLLQ
ncbi:MAG: hypothetical protein JWQ04_472 [Pedosphaera sp.]|nr:hypothetical protein [Pedosphaera sp.]